MTDQLSALLQDRWYILAIVLVAVFLVIRLIKTAVKWLLVIVIAAGVIGYGSHYMSTFQNQITDKALAVIAGGAQGAVYKMNDDGSFTVTANNITIQGKPGSNEVKVTFLGQTFTMKMDDVLQRFIEQAKKAQ